MFYLALLSGLINLSAQTVYQKIVSMAVGDLYTTFMAVLLTFIVGAAIGGYWGFHLRRFLPWIELFSGLYAMALFIPLNGPFYNYDIALPWVILALLPPAFALGTHVPLYSYYLRRQRFGVIYSLYHWGAILGLLAFEWHFVHAGSVKYALLFLGVCQTVLGLGLIHLARAGKFRIPRGVFAVPFGRFWFGIMRDSTLAVLAASTLSFFHVLWALKTQVMLTEGYRLEATMVSAAILFWMSAGGLMAKILPRYSRPWNFMMMAIAMTLIQATFAWLPTLITDLNNGEAFGYFAMSLTLATYLTLPVFFSSLLFVREAESAAQRIEVDQASGGLNVFASCGNILGFVLGGMMAGSFWSPPYFSLEITLCIFAFVAFSLKSQDKKTIRVGALILVILVSTWALRTQQQDALFTNRILKPARAVQEMTDVWVRSHALSSMALYTRKFTVPVTTLPPALQADAVTRRFYIVDGHTSHDIFSGGEVMSGIAGAKYFNRPIKNSLVVGIGSGQAAWGVASISEHTDMVEISPVVIENLSYLKEYNQNLIDNPRKDIHLKDGFSFVRDCTPESYELILNTATYPSNFNASKLYSTEFVGLAKKCLTANGVFQTYFDFTSVINMTQFNEFLAPLRAHFKYVDVMLEPYPQVFAYDQPRNIEKIQDSDFPRKEDLSTIQKLQAEGKLFKKDCQDFLRNPPAPATAPAMNTLDRAYLEANSFKNSIAIVLGTFEAPEVPEFFQPPPGKTGSFTCE